MIFQYDWGTPLYVQSVYLRHDILREPLGLRFYTDELISETSALHFGYFNNCFDLYACLYLVPQNNEVVRLKQMAVRDDLHKKGFGRLLVEGVEEAMKLQGYETFILHARAESVGFYEKIGYKIISKKFMEIGIPHFKMQKILK